MGMDGQRHNLASLPPERRPGTHYTGDWVGLRADVDRCGKARPPPGFDPRTVKPVASRYTDWATTAPQGVHRRPMYFVIPQITDCFSPAMWKFLSKIL